MGTRKRSSSNAKWLIIKQGGYPQEDIKAILVSSARCQKGLVVYPEHQETGPDGCENKLYDMVASGQWRRSKSRSIPQRLG